VSSAETRAKLYRFLNSMAHLFEPLTLRGVTLRNRIAVSPMCEYSSIDGFANDWHLVHLGSRAVGGAGLVFTEATAVESSGRISPHDLGIYRDEHIERLADVTGFILAQGAIPGIQLAHAGRKASTAAPWDGGRALEPAQGGWRPIFAPSALPFSDDSATPQALSGAEIRALVTSFVVAAERAVDAGFRVVEIHAAHGYLAHEFLSPLSNARTDEYGGSFENRTRFVREVASGVRAVLPETTPLFVRISATDWVDGGWNIDESVALAKELRKLGVDLIDASSGGLSPAQRIVLGPGYQVPFAERIRAEAGIATGAVGMITEPQQAEAILRDGQADIVSLAREMLRDPYWPLRASVALGADGPWPKQYQRAKPVSAAV
jgi:2,4-dienoyl-CoA reductase-like NADH-dependent reductase (Old Yellow Enzyme family)